MFYFNFLRAEMAPSCICRSGRSKYKGLWARLGAPRSPSEADDATMIHQSEETRADRSPAFPQTRHDNVFREIGPEARILASWMES
jgi:hypothetical protein